MAFLRASRSRLKSTPARHAASNIRPGLTRPKPEHFSTRTALRSLSSASLRPPQREFAQVPRALRRQLDRQIFFYRVVEREARPEE